MGVLLRGAAWAALAALVVAAPAARAEPRRIYIRPFTATQGLAPGDRTGTLVRDHVSEVIVERGGYSLVSDDEVAQVLAREKAIATLGTADPEQVFARLAASLKCDTIVFGTVALADGRYTVTIKQLDASGKTVRLERVKTLTFQGARRLRPAARDLALYVLTGEEPDRERYDHDEDAWLYGRLPTAVGVSWVRYGPTATTFERYYGALNGAAAQGLLGFARFFSASAELSWATASDRRTGSASVSLGAVGLGLRAGLPVRDTVVPYVGVVGKALRMGESGGGRSASFTGFGVDGLAGVSVGAWKRFSAFAEYRRGFATLQDAGKTDVSGSTLSIGLLWGLR